MPSQYAGTSYAGGGWIQVTIDGLDIKDAVFKRVTGLVSQSSLEQTEGGRSGGGRARGPVPVTYSPVMMERFFKGMDDFYRWRLEVEKGNVERKNVRVTLMDQANKPVRAMTLIEAWPSRWEMPSMETEQPPAPVERITMSARKIIESAVGGGDGSGGGGSDGGGESGTQTQWELEKNEAV